MSPTRERDEQAEEARSEKEREREREKTHPKKERKKNPSDKHASTQGQMDDEVDLWKGRLTAIAELDQVDPPDWLDCGSNQRQKEIHSFDRGRGPEPQIS
jgi:hypothetical protein